MVGIHTLYLWCCIIDLLLSADAFKAPILKLTITHPSQSPTRRKKPHIITRFRITLGTLLSLTNPYASSKSTTIETTTTPDCVICLSGIGPYQALFLSPCSHCFHFKCVKGLLNQGHMFLCPLCRQVANLDASVSMESLCDLAGGKEEETDSREEGNMNRVESPCGENRE